jgi:hypothetical protein
MLQFLVLGHDLCQQTDTCTRCGESSLREKVGVFDGRISCQIIDFIGFLGHIDIHVYPQCRYRVDLQSIIYCSVWQLRRYRYSCQFHDVALVSIDKALSIVLCLPPKSTLISGLYDRPISHIIWLWII